MINKYKKLDSVINSLNKSNLIGNLDEEMPYISGELELAWSSYGAVCPPEESPITFWGGMSNGTLLGLAGSKYHLLGKQEGNIVGSASLTPDIAYWLCKTLEIPMLSFSDQTQPYSDTKFTFNNGNIDEYDLANAVYLAAYDHVGKSKFTAKFTGNYCYHMRSKKLRSFTLPAGCSLLFTKLFRAITVWEPFCTKRSGTEIPRPFSLLF